MSTLDIRIEGIGFWASGWPHWPAARAGLRGELQADPAVIKPSPGILVAAERRRAPLPVLLACEVATQACAESGHAVDSLASVFASTHGDLVITDYMCSTVASAPRELSPIKFHNSVRTGRLLDNRRALPCRFDLDQQLAFDFRGRPVRGSGAGKCRSVAGVAGRV